MHPLYPSTKHATTGGGGDSPDNPGPIPQVYIDIGRMVSDVLRYRYVDTNSAELLFDAIVSGLEACDVPHIDAEFIRAQLWESMGRGDQ